MTDRVQLLTAVPKFTVRVLQHIGRIIFILQDSERNSVQPWMQGEVALFKALCRHRMRSLLMLLYQTFDIFRFDVSFDLYERRIASTGYNDKLTNSIFFDLDQHFRTFSVLTR